MTYPFKPLETRVNNTDVKLVGVVHNSPFWTEHRKHLTEEVKDAQAIALESDEKHEGPYFFRNFMRSAVSNDLSFYLIDSNCTDRLLSTDIAMIGKTLLGATLATEGIYNSVKPTSRRQFLKSMVRATVGTSIFLGGIPALMIDHVTGGLSKNNPFSANPLLWDPLTDYRNIVMAENIDRLTKQSDSETQLTVFTGAFHSKGIQTYLDNPILRAKRITYLPFDLYLDDTVEKFERVGEEYQKTHEI